MEKQTAGQKSCRLSVTNPSPAGTESIEFSADTRDDLEEWLDALHQHLYDQGERCKSMKRERPVAFVPIAPLLVSHQASGCTAANS